MLLSVSITYHQSNWVNNHTEFDEVLKLADRASPSAEGTVLIDARPVPSYQDGHIPTSLTLDFPSSLLHDPATFTYLRNPEDLKEYISRQLGQDKLDQILSRKVTVVNSKFDLFKVLKD